MQSLDDARALIANRVHTLAAERIPLSAALGRTLRESIAASEDMPAFSRSAFDGYAFAAGENGRLRVAQEIAAGAASMQPIGAGECARIFTGAPLPPGAYAVAMQEHVVRDGDFAEIPVTASGHGVRARGEDARAGDLLLERGQRLGPIELSLLATLGHTQPLVAPRPRILHVVTGSELVSPDATPAHGQIRDSNTTLIAALAADCEMITQLRAGDEMPSLLNAIHSVPHDVWDVLLISGGASVGDYDFGARALAESGFSVHFTALNLRPGKPLIFATRGRQCAFVIPGNPLSHFVCWHVGIRAALDVLVKGEASFELATLPVTKELRGNARETWWPARIVWRKDGPCAEPLRWQSSGDLTALAGVNALLRIPSNSPTIAAGEKISALLI